MPLYDFTCKNHHDYEVRCSIADKDGVPHPCPICQDPGHSVISKTMLNDSSKMILDYPGSKRLKAGYVHSHGDKMATRTMSGPGGMVQANNKRHHHPIAQGVIPDPVRNPKKL